MSKVVDFQWLSTGVGQLTIQREEALNALNGQVIDELDQFFSESHQELRALIVTGSGSKAFVAGADIKEIASLDVEQAKQFAARGQRVFRKIEQSPFAVVAAVNGFALGGGLELALACDFIYASEKAKLGLPEITLGIMPGFGGTVRLSRTIGLNKARELMFSGDFLAAEQALQWGIVNRVFAAEELLAATQAYCEKLARLAPIALSEIKKCSQLGFDQPVDQAMETEREGFSRLFSTSDQKEGTAAFVEKRKPHFSGQ